MGFDEDEGILFGSIGDVVGCFNGSDDLRIASFDGDDAIGVEGVVNFGEGHGDALFEGKTRLRDIYAENSAANDEGDKEADEEEFRAQRMNVGGFLRMISHEEEEERAAECEDRDGE